jgi:hypothetical protein
VVIISEWIMHFSDLKKTHRQKKKGPFHYRHKIMHRPGHVFHPAAAVSDIKLASFLF